MSLRYRLALSLVGLSALAFLGIVVAAEAPSARPAAQLEHYVTPAGESYFSLALSPEALSPEFQSNGKPRDVVLLFDTSASQMGPVRDKALASLEAMLAKLDPQDRVQLMSVDLEATPMTDRFVAPQGDAMQAALDKLRGRVPLGTTDMAHGLDAALGALGQGDTAAEARPRCVVYLGDGICAANLLATEQFRKLVDRLVAAQIPVSSYAIGPRLDNQLLGALANHTGGVLAIDNDQTSAETAGDFFAKAVRAEVAWPVQETWPAGFREVFPKRMPPLRSDRPSVVIGVGNIEEPTDLAVDVRIGDQPLTLKWTVRPAGDSDDNDAYLVSLVDFARKDGGIALPLAGDGGLVAARGMIESQVEQFNRLARISMDSGTLDEAQRLAARAAELDPSNPETQALTVAIAERQQGGRVDAPARVVAAQPVEPAQEFEPDDHLLNEVEAQRQRLAGYLETEVRAAVNDARRMMRDDPSLAINRLKLTHELVQRTQEVDPDIRRQLNDQVEQALREASRQQFIQTERQLHDRELEAVAEDRRELNRDLYLKEQKIDQLMKRFESLIEQDLFKDAETVAIAAREIDRTNVPPWQATEYARLTGNWHEAWTQRELRRVGVVDALAAVERSHIPTSDEPPIVYPDPETWRRLTERRKESTTVDLSVYGPTEQRILEALDEKVDVEYQDEPLEQVIQFLASTKGIPIVLDRKAIEEEGQGTDAPVTIQLKAVSLKSALRHLLRDLNLTYLIEDEVLLITTAEKAKDRLATKVYPVADLVVPIISIGGGGGMGGGGFGIGGGGGFGGGGGGGFGGGGFGGGGGGFGGGGFGGGGGGFGGGAFNIPPNLVPGLENVLPQNIPPGGFRAFNVKDDREDGDDAPNAAAPNPPAQAPAPAGPPVAGPQERAKPIQLTIPEGADPQVIWNDYFADHQEKPAVVAETARMLGRKGRFDQVIALIQGAIRNSQAQPWMYEGLALAIQADGGAPQDVERALLSALDFSNSPSDMMYVAIYLARNGFDARALSLFRQVSTVEPTRPEPYMHGMKIAERLGNADGILWATTGILSQAWPNDKAAVWQTADRLAKATLEKFRSAGQEEQANAFQKELDQALVRDCLAVVTWSGDADVDIAVQEPSGTVCSLRNPRTTSGGVLLGDAFARTSGRSSEEFREVYVCPQGFSGEYRLLLRRAWGKPTAGKVTVDVYTHFNSDQVVHVGRQIPFSDDQAMVVFQLENGRRVESLEDRQVAQAAERANNNRQILAQQLNALADQGSLADLAYSRAVASNGGRFPFPAFGGAVGYAPQITVLPEGSQMSILPSVISADRRYVRITPIPFFSAVTEVNTFNFVTGASGTSNGGGGGGFSGGGGGGFGGGGGGLGGFGT